MFTVDVSKTDHNLIRIIILKWRQNIDATCAMLYNIYDNILISNLLKK